MYFSAIYSTSYEESDLASFNHQASTTQVDTVAMAVAWWDT